jgi:AraC-like DNA-binding protein
MDLKVYFDLFSKASGIPAVLLKDGKKATSFGIPESLPEMNPIRLLPEEPAASEEYPLAVMKDEGFFGIFRDKKTDILVGPVYSTALTRETCRAFMRANAIPGDRFEEVFSFLSTIPVFSLPRFFNMLSFIEYQLHGRAIDITAHFHIEKNNYEPKLAKETATATYDRREDSTIHGSYVFEQQMMDLIRQGKTEELETLINSYPASASFREGTVGTTPLRQRKNIFNASVAAVGKFAAIPGGLDVEETYQLIDLYTMECERAATISAINDLQYNMLLDFSNRVQQAQIPMDIDRETFACIQYINGHINEDINVDDVARHIHRSRSYTSRHFREILGFTIGQYITHAKIQEAKSLLIYTEKSLAEISAYLCFSTQSYFQNTFKKVTGMTPLAFRKKNGR